MLTVLSLPWGCPGAALAQTSTEEAALVAADPNDDDPRSDEKVAKGLFEAGRAAYDAGRFDAALRDFQDAYARSPRPKLLFNIGQSADRLRMDELALSSFRKYLEEAVDADNRETVENRVRVLEQVVAERQSAQQVEADSEPVATKPERDVSIKVEASPAQAARELPLGPIIVGGVGVALIGGGIGFALLAASAEDDYAQAPVSTMDEAKAARDLLDGAKTKALVANVLLVGGGVSLAAAAVWYLLGRGDAGDDNSKELSVAPLWSSGAYGLQVSGLLDGAL